MKLVVDDVKQLLGGVWRLGMDSLDTVGHWRRRRAAGTRGRARPADVARWLEAHQHAGGAGPAVVARFVRFTVLHELRHVLNGDHRTFRFVRGVLIAQLVWGRRSTGGGHVSPRNS